MMSESGLTICSWHSHPKFW